MSRAVICATLVGMTTNATALSGALPGNARQTDSYVITAMNGKGGVAKTMVILSLAAHTVAAHGRALVVDVDPQATAYDLTQTLRDPGYEVVHELDPVELTRIRQLRDFDTILVDCPGSLEGHDVLDEVLARSTYVIIPYDHTPESVLPTLRTARKVKESGVPYAVVVTKADPRLGAEFIMDAWAMLEKEQIRYFRTAIRWYRAWPNSLKAGVPITRWNERYAPRLREDIASLHTELLLDLGRRALAGSA
jgi:chromosome partitioning protein